MSDWWIYKGSGIPHDDIQKLPPPPRWRQFSGKVLAEREFAADSHLEWRFGEGARGASFQVSPEEIDVINSALYLRRPLLVTGKPGIGKSTLAYAVAYELNLGPVLRWSITTRSTLQEGLYRYDAIGRLQDARLQESIHSQSSSDIGKFISLGPLGTALLPSRKPRVLLIDEIDKSDIDLPNDLLNVFEEGEFEIPELTRLADVEQVLVKPFDANDRVHIERGHVQCRAFPFVVLTSNGEREFPAPFLRRCIPLTVQPPDKEKLTRIVESHLGKEVLPDVERIIEVFLDRREQGDLATDQLLNAIYLATRGVNPLINEKEKLLEAVLQQLNRIRKR